MGAAAALERSPVRVLSGVALQAGGAERLEECVQPLGGVANPSFHPRGDHAVTVLNRGEGRDRGTRVLSPLASKVVVSSFTCPGSLDCAPDRGVGAPQLVIIGSIAGSVRSSCGPCGRHHYSQHRLLQRGFRRGRHAPFLHSERARYVPNSHADSRKSWFGKEYLVPAQRLPGEPAA